MPILPGGRLFSRTVLVKFSSLAGLLVRRSLTRGGEQGVLGYVVWEIASGLDAQIVANIWFWSGFVLSMIR